METTRPLRTAIVTTSWPAHEDDPAGHFVRADARSREASGEKITVIAAEGDAFGWPGVAARIEANPLRLGNALAWVRRARRQVMRGKFDQVVAHWALPCAWPIAMKGNHALAIVSHGGDIRLLTRIPRLVRAPLVRTLAARATSWQFVADHLLARLTSDLPQDIARAVERIARVEPCAVEVIAPSAEALEAKRVRMGRPFLVCVARLVETKRVDAAITWAARRGTPLVVVGDGPERARLETHARLSSADVTFVGKVPRSDALAWIGASTGVLNASRVEGASTVEREARALGVAVRSI